MSSYMSAYQRPQRELLSLKTEDIEGAVGKHKIYEKKLIYQNDDKKYQYQEHTPRADLYAHGDRRNEFDLYSKNLDGLPDPYELENSVRQTSK